MSQPSTPVASTPGNIWRRLAAEFLGTGLLVTTVVGSGIAASRLSPHDVGLQLLENSTATALGLTVLILAFGPLSGAHFNPIVSFADWFVGRKARTGITAPMAGLYVLAQIVGAVLGAILANVMFAVPTSISTTARATPGHLVGEVVATAGLILVIFALARTGRAVLAAPVVGAYIGAAYWFTSSTSFANPAVTIGRIFTDTFAGICPPAAAWFIGAQLVGGVLGVVLVLLLFPSAARSAENVVVPSDLTR